MDPVGGPDRIFLLYRFVVSHKFPGLFFVVRDFFFKLFLLGSNGSEASGM